MIKIDRKDRKILYALDTDSRQSFQEIGKVVGLSKDAVKYRIDRLEAAGIIDQYHTVIDVGKLGYISFRLYLQLQDTTPLQEEEIVAWLKAKPTVCWLVSIDGEYDIGLWLLVRTIEEAHLFWQELLERYRRFIARRKLTIFSQVTYFPRAYFLEQEHNQEEHVFITAPVYAALDEKELGILGSIAEDARKPVVDIAREVGVTAKTVAMKIRDLEKKKVIVGYRTKFDLGRLGYQYFKVDMRLREYAKDEMRKLRQYMKQHPNVIFDNEVLGGEDIEMEVQVRSLEELRAIIQEFKTRFASYIQDCRYYLFYHEHKFVFLPNENHNR